MKNTNEIDGWFNYEKTYDFLINTIPNDGIFVECGAWLGKSSSYLCDKISSYRPDIKIYIVDSWMGSKDELTSFHYLATITDIYQIFLSNMGDRVFTPIKELSVDACQQFDDNSLDVIFIDMGHSYDDIKQDLSVWYPKLKKNGYIAGHDWSRPEVHRAVTEQFDHIQTSWGDCWIYHNSGENL